MQKRIFELIFQCEENILYFEVKMSQIQGAEDTLEGREKKGFKMLWIRVYQITCRLSFNA